MKELMGRFLLGCWRLMFYALLLATLPIWLLILIGGGDAYIRPFIEKGLGCKENKYKL